MRLIDPIKEARRNQAIAIQNAEDISGLAAKDAMIKPVLVYEGDDGDEILKKLKKEETNVCIVVTKDKKFVGEISDEDLIRLFMVQVTTEPLTEVLQTGYRREFAHKKAGQLINKHKSTITQDTPINKVIELIHNEGFQYLPVLDEEKKVLGVVTPSSVLDLLQDR
jgi:osmoprotectant transport system ATP-binding protein